MACALAWQTRDYKNCTFFMTQGTVWYCASMAKARTAELICRIWTITVAKDFKAE